MTRDNEESISPDNPATRGATRRVKAHKTQQAQPDFTRSLAVVIGINDYQHDIPQLKTAASDAHHLAKILAESYHYDLHLLIENVNKARLIHLLEETLPGQVGPDDRVLFYFAGHGLAVEGEAGPTGYLLPQDADLADDNTLLKMTYLHDTLMALPCRHLLIILDCCFAGAMRWSTTRAVLTPPQTIHEERYKRFIQSPACQLITSAAHNQKALDIARGNVLNTLRDQSGQTHSPFALALFDALGGAADIFPPAQAGQPPGDGLLTAMELYLYLRDRVETTADAQAHYQTPGLWPLRNHREGEYVFQLPDRDLNLPPAPALNYENNPYLGLNAYDSDQYDLFFGRTALTQTLVQTVTRQPLTVVLGASGTGKSSLVKAGLLPVLTGKVTSETVPSLQGQSWRVLPPLRLTDDPLTALATLLRDNLDLTVTAEPVELKRAIQTWGQANPAQILLLVIDQFEELVTLCRDEAERTQFLTLLAQLLDTLTDQLRLVVTLRSDFEPQLADLTLRPYWVAARFVVPPLSPTELREVIEGPASVRVLYFNPPELVERLITEVSQTPGALPLLSFTLSEMYLSYIETQSNDRALTQANYEALGGVIGSLRQRATAEYDRLDPAQQATMRRVMVRMVAVEGGELTRRQVLRTELEYADPVENDRVNLVLQRLIAARLLVVGGESEGQVYVEPAHDALVRAWDKLVVWIRQAEEVLPLQRKVTEAAEDWQTIGSLSDPTYLWHNNARLPQVEQVLLTDGGEPWLNRLEHAFIQESITLKKRNQRRLFSTIGATILILAGLAFFALIQRNSALIAEENAINEAARAETQARLSRSGQLAAQSEAIPLGQTSQSLLLALEALNILPEDDFLTSPTQALYAALRRPSSQRLGDLQITTDRIIFSPDRQWLIAGDAEGTVHLWSLADLDRSAKVWAAHPNRIDALTISPAGQWLASADTETVRLWPLPEPGAEPVAEVSATEGVIALAFSPDGDWLAIAENDGTISQWSTVEPHTSPQIIEIYDQGSPKDLAFSPDGQWLAVGFSDEEIHLWSRSNFDREPTMFTVAQFDGIEKIGFSPDSQSLVTAGATNVQLWSLIEADETEVVSLQSPESEVFTTAFSPDGQWLAVGSYAQTVHLWSVDAATQPPIILGHGAPIMAASFRPDSQTLLTVGEQGLIREWSLSALQQGPVELFSQSGRGTAVVSFSPDGQWLATKDQDDNSIQLLSTNNLHTQPHLLDHGDEYVESFAFSPDSQWLVTGSDQGQVRRWSVDDLQAEGQILFEHPDLVGAIASAPNGDWLASSDAAGGVKLWSLSTLAEGPQDLSGAEIYDIGRLAFSPDGRWLAGGEFQDPIVWVWSLEDLQPPRKLQADGNNGVVVAFSTDGQYLAAANEADTIELWLTADNFAHVAHTLRGHTDFINGLAFSPNGQWLASGSIDGTVRLWSLAHLEVEPIVLQGVDNGHDSLTFSPDGQWLVAGSVEKPALLWQMNLDKLTARACQAAGRNFTLEEWDRYFRSEPYRQTCSEWPAASN